MGTAICLFLNWKNQISVTGAVAYLSNTLTNLCIVLYCSLLYCVVLNCIVLLIYCYVDIIQYNAMHNLSEYFTLGCRS